MIHVVYIGDKNEKRRGDHNLERLFNICEQSRQCQKRNK